MRIKFDNLENMLVQGNLKVPTPRRFGHAWMGLHHLLEAASKQFPKAAKTSDVFYQLDPPTRQVTLATLPYSILDSSSEISDSQFYTDLDENQLRQLHRRFGHPTAQRLLSLLESAGFEDLDTETVQQINKICGYCQLQSKAPMRFKFSLKEDVNFNSSIVVDVMYLEGKPVLHIVDTATSFQNGRFLSRGTTAKHIWRALRSCWIDTYVGPPDMIVIDAGTNFASKEFGNEAKALGIEVKEVPIEAHHSIGKVESYHQVVERIFTIFRQELPQELLENLLQMTMKAINDTAGPNGLTPTLLVFGTYPRMTEFSPPSPSVSQRSLAIEKATKELRRIKAKRQVNSALSMRNGPVPWSAALLPIQSQVLVYRENKGWRGPYLLKRVDGHNCILEIKGKDRKFRSTSVKLWHDDPSKPIGNEDQDNREDTSTETEDLPDPPTSQKGDDEALPPNKVVDIQ